LRVFLPTQEPLAEERVVYKNLHINLVIPAQAGIQAAYPSSGDNHGPLDCRLRGDDEGKAALCTQAGSGAQVGSAARYISFSPRLRG